MGFMRTQDAQALVEAMNSQASATMARGAEESTRVAGMNSVAAPKDARVAGENAAFDRSAVNEAGLRATDFVPTVRCERTAKSTGSPRIVAQPLRDGKLFAEEHSTVVHTTEAANSDARRVSLVLPAGRMEKACSAVDARKGDSAEAAQAFAVKDSTGEAAGTLRSSTVAVRGAADTRTEEAMAAGTVAGTITESFTPKSRTINFEGARRVRAFYTPADTTCPLRALTDSFSDSLLRYRT
jgi:hypothetical protein